MLSIIIPALNEEKYLPDLLESLQAQAFKDYEIIVADSNSADDTHPIALKAGARIVGGGLPAYGRNRGAEVARVDWLLFLDADVVLPFNFLEKAMTEIQEQNLSVASCPIAPLSDRKIDKLLHHAVNLGFQVTKNIYPHAPGFCIFIKKEYHLLIGGFNEKILLAEDSDYVLRASKICKFGLLQSVRILVSVRRLDKDGRLNIAVKYLASDAYRILIGPIESNIFNYQFGYPTEKLSNKTKYRNLC